MKVVITSAAQHDLVEIDDFIASDNPARAVSFLKELRQSCADLAPVPYAYPVVPRYKHLGIRRRVHGAYLILFRVIDTEIQVLRIAHGRRDLDRLLFRDLT